MERLGRITTSLPDLPIDRRMTYGAMRRAIIGLPVTVSSAILPDGLWGCYDGENNVILIDRRLTYAAKRCTLVHELLHWRHGDTGCSNNSSKLERRTRRQAAHLLIDPAELALAERMYDDDLWSIADELNVTMQVLTDYQAMLNTSRIKERFSINA
ncbi:ImmA/IrrE family metallo-endopeptidase [Bifidobacterium breve]|uniref:ImmA/IrrE family metallo-endopeptidase n=1 Tax=Bifidobacterium breve TaxID=1685 RepID=UPI003B9D2D39